MYNRWMEHSAKGTTWHKKDHKYKSIDSNGNYIYDNDGTYEDKNYTYRKDPVDGSIIAEPKDKSKYRNGEIPEANVEEVLDMDMKKKSENYYQNKTSYSAFNKEDLDEFEDPEIVTYEKFKKNFKKTVNSGRKWLNALFGI